MPDFNPNEMDALFREGADRHEFKYNPDAWALMEEKLDRKDRRRRFLYILLGLLFLVIAFVGYKNFDFSNESEDQPAITSAVSNFENEINQKQTITDIPSQELNKEKVDALENANDQQKIQKNYISSDSKERRSNIGAQNSFLSESTGNLMGHEIVSIGSLNEGRKEEKTVQNTIVLDDEVTPSITKEETNFLINKELINIATLQNDPLTPLAYNRGEVDKSKLEITSGITENVIPSISNRWTLTSFANPEWSSVGLFKESKTGWSFGTRIGYQFADKFELSAGIAYSRKIYKGGGEAYTMAGGWYDNIEPMRMDAKCDVFEIPIGLSYHLNGFRNSGFFIDAGINSYMMHSEWYGFEYDDLLVRPDRYLEVNEEDQNSHLVGVGRVAFGYHKVLSNQTSFQVAPYLQFPLTGIGAGRVNVYSSGVQLAIKFNTQ